MTDRKPIDLPYYLELKYPLHDLIFRHEYACREARIPYQVLWKEHNPCLVCTWEDFDRFLSFSALQVMTERIRQFMEAQEAALREAYPRGRIPITVSFSDCRGQCTFSNLPDMATGRALAEQTGEFLTQLLDSSVAEEAASQTPGKKRT